MAADAHQSFLNSKFQLMREAADKCEKLGDDYKGRATVANEFVNVLEESSEYLEDSCENIEDATENVNKLLEEVYSVLKSPSGQALLDDLILDLPDAMLKILNKWENSWSLCERIMVHACQNGNPREMITAIGEALTMNIAVNALSSLLLLTGFSIAMVRVRRPVENITSLIFLILNAAKVAGSNSIDSVTISPSERLVDFAKSLQKVSVKTEVEGKQNKLKPILGFYILEILALISKDSKLASSFSTSNIPPLILTLTELITYCGLSYQGLISGKDVEGLTESLDDEQLAEFMPLIKKGSVLAVIWGYMYKENATEVTDNTRNCLAYLESNSNNRITALINMKDFLSSFLEYPFEIQNQCLKLMVDILNVNSNGSRNNNENFDWPCIMPSVLVLLQAMQQIVIYLPHVELRKEAFSVFKMVISQLPTPQKFDIMKNLILQCRQPSMTSLLLGIVKDEVSQVFIDHDNVKNSPEISNKKDLSYVKAFLSEDLLQLLGSILKPASGPPKLPEQNDMVLAALNVYRFLLMKALNDKSIGCIALSKSSLQTSESEWLLPLRTLVSAIQYNFEDGTGFAYSGKSGLYLVELALYHCLELVDELKSCKR